MLMRIGYSLEISDSPDTIFPWIADPSKAMRWQKNVKGGTIHTSRPGFVGTTFTEVIEEDGNTLEMEGVITDYKENEMIGFQLESKIHAVDVKYSVEGNRERSIVSIDARIHWKFPMNILSIFLGRRMRTGIADQTKSELLELKRLCESISGE